MLKLIPETILTLPAVEIFAICLLLFAVLTVFLLWRIRQQRREQGSAQRYYAEQLESLQAELCRVQTASAADQQQLELANTDKEAGREAKHQLQLQLAKLEGSQLSANRRLLELPQKEELIASLQQRLASTNTKLEQQQHGFIQQQQFFEQTREQMTAQFEALSSKIYQRQSKQFTEQSQQSMDSVINPLKTQIKEFREKVESSYDTENAQRNILAGKISELQQQTQKIGQDAINLASALKGDNKAQGNWGEVILERLLEDSGLQKGREYDTQVALQNEAGDRLLPDVVIRLPQNKDIVIDAKMSLLDYEVYCSAEDETAKQQALKNHVASLRSHIRGLSLKEYDRLEGIRSLDFVFLFIPVEAAFMLAMQADHSLFQEAYNRHIVLVSPTTLLASLRTVGNLWRFDKQHKNAEKIADQAGALHDQFVLMLASLDDMGKQLEKTNKAFDTTKRRLSSGRGNLLKRVQDIRELGAKTKKTIPEAYLDQLDDRVPGLAEQPPINPLDKEN